MGRLKSFCIQAALACTVGLTTAAAMAQTPPAQTPPAQTPPGQASAASTPVSPLTVEGTPRKVLEKQAHDFVDAHGAPTRKLGVLARWNDEPACIAVSGLVAAQAADFKTRIEAVANTVKAPVAPPKCKPNVEIVFTAQPQHYLDAAAAKNPAILGDQGAKTVTRPIQAWYAIQDFGVAARSEGPLDDAPPPAKGENRAEQMARIIQKQREQGQRRCVDPGVAAHNNRMENPAFSATPTEVSNAYLVGDLPCPHSLFLNVLIVVDAAHMGDVPVDVTADYLALVVLSQPKPRSLDGCLALPSVFDLYAKDCPGREAPTGLTPADKAYLTGLYAADLTVVQFQQSEQSDIAGRMIKILDKDK